MNLHEQKRPGIEYDLGDRIVLRFCGGKTRFPRSLALAKETPVSDIIFFYIHGIELYCENCISKRDRKSNIIWASNYIADLHRQKRHEDEYNLGRPNYIAKSALAKETRS